MARLPSHSATNDHRASTDCHAILFAPGAPREAYFEGLAEIQRSGRPSDEEMADFYRLHDNIWVDSQ